MRSASRLVDEDDGTHGTMSTKTARRLTMAITRISRSIMMGLSPALRAEEDDENLGPVSDNNRFRRLSCENIVSPRS
jgi:hypothetical protein